MFENFDIKPFKKKKPPSDGSYTTHTELNELRKIPLNKSFVKKFDDIESAFAKTAKDNNIKDYDKKIAADFIKKSAPIILDLKKYHNRKRPYELDKKLKAVVLKSMQTPSYPSGHSVQGTGIAKMLADKYPKAKSAFLQTGKNISYSRRVAHAHYLSDSKDGDQLGIKMYNHTKNN
tara:strand:+ start:162 stop:689 length:528 start_codon:yes stop_codon:yes gene_type:complete